MSGVEVFAMAVFPFLLVKVWVDIVAGYAALGLAAAWTLLLMPLGVVGAVLLTGFLHFLADNFGDERTPFLGPAFVFRFRQHHEQPGVICTLTFRELNAPAIMLCTPVLLPFAIWVPTATTQWGLALSMIGATLVLFSALTNQFHRWAHAPGPRHPIVDALQRSGLILRPDHHAAHHRAPHDVHFSITNGWLDSMLDRSGAWHRAADFLVTLGARQAPESALGSRPPATRAK